MVRAQVGAQKLREGGAFFLRQPGREACPDDRRELQVGAQIMKPQINSTKHKVILFIMA